MAKLIELKDAARTLGITPDELIEMRSRNEIFGVSSGSTWKFKEQEIERVARVLAESTSPAVSDSQDSIELDIDDVDLTDDGDNESILVSEKELGQSDDTTSSTIIGKPDPVSPGSGGGSAISLDDVTEGSELRLAGSGSLNMDSDILDGNLSSGPSDTNIGDEESELKLEVVGDGDDSFDFDLDDGEVSLDANVSDAVKASSSGFGSAIDLDLDDDELVLGSGSDVTAGVADSGINLSNPSDSGLSLDEPLDLTGGSSIDSLELGEDDDMIVLDEESATEIPTDLQADNDFLLTPVEEADDESSGSQEIDLDSGEFDESAASILANNASPMDDLEAVDFEPDGVEVDDFETVGSAAAATGALGATPRLSASAEPTYSIVNVVSLFAIVLFLGLTGIMMLDLINNIWSWDRNYSFNSPIMDTILSMLGSS